MGQQGVKEMRALIFVTFLTLVGLAAAFYSPDSKAYWESVGPTWDKMLNPCSYEACNDN